jgi:hypothetical protein
MTHCPHLMLADVEDAIAVQPEAVPPIGPVHESLDAMSYVFCELVEEDFPGTAEQQPNVIIPGEC